MNRFFGLVAFLMIGFFTYGFYLSQYQFDAVSQANLSTTFFTYQINSNIHTNLTLGSGSIVEIVDDAQKIQSKYLLITDINNNVDLEQDRYVDRIGVLFARKYLTEQGRFVHYLNIRKKTDSTKEEFINFLRTNKSNDLIYLAHPVDKPYSAEYLKGLNVNGFEVINLKRMTQATWERSKLSTIWSILFYPFNPKLALIRLFIEPSDELALFDSLSLEKKMTMYLGSEASARAIPFADWLIKFPTYERTLSIASQHLVLNSELRGDIEKDSESIETALKNGNFYLAFDTLGETKGFEAFAKDDKSTQMYKMGETIPFSQNLKLYFQFPEPNVFYEIILFRNGKRVDHFNTFKGSFQLTTPGTYRIQVRLSTRLPLPDAIKWITWIYTNNFDVK